jgi:septal ring factor EnvC (AmiA/AmiB activator)
MFYLLLGFLSLSVCSRAGDEEIKKKQSQLSRLRKEISGYEKKIKDRERKERATLDLLDTYDRQTALLRKLIADLHREERSLQTGIETTRRTIDELNGQLTFLKRQYASYVTAAYKYGQTYDLELLLSSKSLNQALVRAEYLKRFSNQRKNDLEKIDARRDSHEEQRELLQRQLSEQRDLIAEKSKEEDRLLQKTSKRKSLLAEIRRDKKNYRKEVNRKLQAAKDMEQLISRLIDAERTKKERTVSRPREENTTSASREATNSLFEVKRGRYPWPVSGGKVVARFGFQQNATLHTVTQNTGIDIAVPAGTRVGAIADGEVSTIWWLPSFGNLVILNHKNGFRTVYAHLSEIFVNEGDNVVESEGIGRSGEALAGQMLHFELWKDRDKQDPEQWLRPRGLSQK